MTAKEKTSVKWFDHILEWQRLFIFSIVLLFILLILAFWVSWKNIDAIKETIRNDFNQQQLVLARQQLRRRLCRRQVGHAAGAKGQYW